MPSLPRSLPRIAVVVISTTLFATTAFASRTDSDVTVITLRHDDWPERRPCFEDSALARAIEDFKASVDERRFALVPRPGFLPVPLALCAVDDALAARGCIGSSGRVLVTPGRGACERQPVPARSRRKVRVWERDLSA